MTEPVRVLIVDDHPLIRRGLRTVISTEPTMELVGEACDADEAVRLAIALDPDVILLDLLMPHRDGISVIEEMRRRELRARILVLTSFSDNAQIFAALRAGAQGYVLKDIRSEELLKAIEDVHRGGAALHPSVAQKLVAQYTPTLSAPDAPHSVDELSAREREVLGFIAQGMTNLEIAQQMSLSERTVAAHVRAILAKLQVTNRTQAALYALRSGLADLDSSH